MTPMSAVSRSRSRRASLRRQRRSPDVVCPEILRSSDVTVRLPARQPPADVFRQLGASNRCCKDACHFRQSQSPCGYSRSHAESTKVSRRQARATRQVAWRAMPDATARRAAASAPTPAPPSLFFLRSSSLCFRSRRVESPPGTRTTSY